MRDSTIRLWLRCLAALIACSTAAADVALGQTIPPPSWLTRHAPALRSVPRVLRPATASFAPDVQVNANLETQDLPQVEPSVTSDPADDRRLVAGFADVLNPVEAAETEAGAADIAPGVSLSSDGGRTWRAPAGGPTLPDPPGFAWGDRADAAHLAGSDSAVGWGVGDRVFFSTLGFHDNEHPPNGDCAAGGLYVYRSDDAGETWTLPAGAPVFPNTSTVFRDKAYVATDADPSSPHVGNLYMVWDDDRYVACPQQFPGNFAQRQIEFARSEDGGATWTTALALATGCIAAPVPAVAGNGDVYVAWYDCAAFPASTLMVAKSVDAGRTFAAPRIAAGVEPAPNPLPGSQFRVVAPFPSLATDPTDARRVYLTWSGNNGANQSDVFVARSLDGGGTWLPPLRVNDDPPDDPRDQFFPWIAVTRAGIVRVMWGDDRLDVANEGGRLYDVFLADSDDQGTSFGSNRRVSTASSDPNDSGFEQQSFIGDYFGISASGVPVWTDTRNGDDDIFAAPLASLGVCGDADGNGAVTVTDGVQVLRAAAELSSSCRPATCDVDGSGGIGVSDGVNVLRKAAGLSASDACPTE